jgi:hypothetical protein
MMRLNPSVVRVSFAEYSAKLLRTRLLTHELGYNLAGVDPQRPCQVNEFYDVDASFADFDSRNDRLRGFKPGGKLVLRKTSRLARASQHGTESAVPTTSKGFQW